MVEHNRRKNDGRARWPFPALLAATMGAGGWYARDRVDPRDMAIQALSLQVARLEEQLRPIVESAKEQRQTDEEIMNRLTRIEERLKIGR